MKSRQRVFLVALMLMVAVISGCSGARASSSVTAVNAAPEAQATAAAQPGAPTISLTTDKTTINKDEQFKVNIDVNGVADLYAADVRLQFDNSKLEVVDSNPNLPGTQIEIGKFLDPSAGQGFVAQNSADNAAGRISYAVTLLSPAKPVTGGGTLATITFKAKDAGAPTISFLNALLTKQDNSTINAQSRPLGAGIQPVQPGGAAQATAAPAPTGGAAQPTAGAQPTTAPAQPTAAPKAAATQAPAAQPGAATAGASVVLDPATASIAVGGTTQIAVKVSGVTNLYGADVRLAFDAAKVEVVDDDAAQAGVQMKQGDCFPAGSQTARNQADNGAGTITFASSRVSPATPVTGACTIITVTLRGKAAGSSQVNFSRTPQLADNAGQPINSSATGATITVGGQAQPTATTAPAPTATTAPSPAPTATAAPGGGTSCTYTVRAGDTLSVIAVRYGTTAAALAQANGLSNPNLIRPGQVLTIPNCSGPVQPPQPGGCFTYTVRAGDTLSAIAARYGTSVPAITQANNLSNPNYIRAGQRLVICAGPGSTPPPPPPPPSGRTYTVRLGDTLSSIALRNGTTTYELARLNGLANANLIYAGQVLRLP